MDPSESLPAAPTSPKKKRKRQRTRKESKPRASVYMPDGKTKRKDFYRNKFLSDKSLTLKALSADVAKQDPNAPPYATIRKWAHDGKWIAQREIAVLDSPTIEPAIVQEMRGMFLQMQAAYADKGVDIDDIDLLALDDAPTAHYSDLVSEKLRPYYAASLVGDKMSLERDIAFADMMLAHYSEIFNAGGSADQWREIREHYAVLRELFEKLRGGDVTAIDGMFSTMRAMARSLSRVQSDDSAEQIAFWQSQKRALVSTELSRVEKGQNYVSVDQAMKLASKKLGLVMGAIQDYNDPVLTLKVCAALGINILER